MTGTVQSKLVYVPQSAGCGNMDVFSGPLLQKAYSKFTQKITNSSQCYRNRIILIQRCKGCKRWLGQHDDILTLLRELVRPYPDLVVHVFGDDPSPNMADTASLFSRAVLVIGPHGAGFSNLLYSPPKTHVLEILCSTKVNLCFQGMSINLGHIYVGLVSNTRIECGEMNIDLDYLRALISNMLPEIHKMVTKC